MVTIETLRMLSKDLNITVQVPSWVVLDNFESTAGILRMQSMDLNTIMLNPLEVASKTLKPATEKLSLYSEHIKDTSVDIVTNEPKGWQDSRGDAVDASQRFIDVHANTIVHRCRDAFDDR